MNIKLLGDRVIVKHKNFLEEDNSGFKLLDNDRERVRQGEVLCAGPGLKGLEMTVKKGDTVLYGRDSGVEIYVENEKVLIMRECDIYSVI